MVHKKEERASTERMLRHASGQRGGKSFTNRAVFSRSQCRAQGLVADHQGDFMHQRLDISGARGRSTELGKLRLEARMSGDVSIFREAGHGGDCDISQPSCVRERYAGIFDMQCDSPCVDKVLARVAVNRTSGAISGLVQAKCMDGAGLPLTQIPRVEFVILLVAHQRAHQWP